MECSPAITPSLESFDAVQICFVAVSGVVKNIFRTKKQIIEEGLTEIPRTQVKNSLQALLYDEPSLVGNVVIDYTTLKPLSWMSSSHQRVGGAMCHLTPTSGLHDHLSARGSALAICRKLKDQGFTMKSAFETEFMLYESDGESPFNNFPMDHFGRLDNVAGKENLLLDICMSLQKAGAPIESFLSELGAGQYEITFRPQESVAGADTAVLMKEALKHQFKNHNALISFMACSNAKDHGTGFHVNHSLWTLDNKNAFLDEDDPKLISDVARHWIAGLIHHSPALCALVCPTVNCYRRFIAAEGMISTIATWAIANRTTLFRVKNTKKNVYIENRLPSAACNPYLAIAGTMAAGLDGIINKFECPPEKDATHGPKIPNSFPEAIDCLEKDSYMCETIGPKIVEQFIRMNRRLLNAKDNGLLSSIKDEREIYFHVI